MKDLIKKCAGLHNGVCIYCACPKIPIVALSSVSKCLTLSLPGWKCGLVRLKVGPAKKKIQKFFKVSRNFFSRNFRCAKKNFAKLHVSRNLFFAKFMFREIYVSRNLSFAKLFLAKPRFFSNFFAKPLSLRVFSFRAASRCTMSHLCHRRTAH